MNRGRCGNPGPPNSGSRPSDPGNRIAASPASQYTLPVKAATRSDSRATSRDVPATSAGRHVRKSVATPSAVLSVMVCPQWNLASSSSVSQWAWGSIWTDDA